MFKGGVVEGRHGKDDWKLLGCYNRISGFEPDVGEGRPLSMQVTSKLRICPG